jgi:hypothetical protein
MKFRDWVVNKVRGKIEGHYERLSARYGESAAKIIIAAALAGSLSPIPGSTLIAALPIVGIAELVKRIRERGLESGAIEDSEVRKVSKDII